MNPVRKLGVRIKNIADYYSISDNELAEVLNIEPYKISHIYTGIKWLSLERLEKLSEYLNISMSFILDTSSITEEMYVQSLINSNTAKSSTVDTVFDIISDYINIKESLNTIS